MQFGVRTKEDLDHIRGIVVTIDVLRAFSTACYIMDKNPLRLEITASTPYAVKSKKYNKNLILLGEDHGRDINGFDYNNSPAQIKKADLTGKDVLLRTTAGTNTMVRIPDDSTVFTGSFVNAEATVQVIQAMHPDMVTFVPTSHKYLNNEDFKCAAYMKSLFEGRALSLSEIRRTLRNHPTSHGFIVEPENRFSKKDYALCLKENIFPFALRRVIRDGKFFLEKIAVS